jgi:hypothetical protein
MKAGIVISLCLLLGMACSKSNNENTENGQPDFSFRIRKNGSSWTVRDAVAFYNKKDSTLAISAYGDNNEQLGFNFVREPLFTGKVKKFMSGVIIPTCEHCASIAEKYSLDSSKANNLEIVGFDNIRGHILGRFSVSLKQDSLYAGPFEGDSSYFEGTFSILYKEVSF